MFAKVFTRKFFFLLSSVPVKFCKGNNVDVPSFSNAQTAHKFRTCHNILLNKTHLSFIIFKSIAPKKISMLMFNLITNWLRNTHTLCIVIKDRDRRRLNNCFSACHRKERGFLARKFAMNFFKEEIEINDFQCPSFTRNPKYLPNMVVWGIPKMFSISWTRSWDRFLEVKNRDFLRLSNWSDTEQKHWRAFCIVEIV